MQFYTPEVVNRWESETSEAIRIFNDGEWEGIEHSYERHFRLTDFPSSVRKFNETVLHGETVISLPKTTDQEGRIVGYARNDDFSVVTGSRSDGLLHLLTYTLEKAPKLIFHSGSGFEPLGNVPVWLYDEFTLDDAGLYCHNVLFSNGCELIVTFKSLQWIESLIQEEG